jgi:hypothetical protein
MNRVRIGSLIRTSAGNGPESLEKAEEQFVEGSTAEFLFCIFTMILWMLMFAGPLGLRRQNATAKRFL